MYRESRVEDDLVQGVRGLGGLCYKFAPVTAGLPDRLVVLPGGRIYLVELKRPRGSTRAVQKVVHRKFLERGVEVLMLSSRQEVAQWLQEVGR